MVVVLYAVLDYYRPKPINWTPTYSNKDKIPFGAKAFYELLTDVFDKQTVKSLRLPAYNHLKETTLPPQSNYVFVVDKFAIDLNDQKQLLNYVSKGNQVFIAAYDFPDTLMTTLGVEARLKSPSLRDTALLINFVNPALKHSFGYIFSHDDGRNYLAIKQPKNITVLAINTRKEAVFLKVKYGKGNFFLHNLPLAFTNYYALKDSTSDFAFKSLSYLSNQPVFWDEYLKQGRFGEHEQSSLRYIISQPALRWGYYLLLLGLLLFVFFAGKRTQRIIPVVEPPKNTSLEFVETIGKMYYQQGDHANIAHKKIQHLMAYIRERWGLKTNQIDADFKQTLADKSGIARMEIDILFSEIAHVERNTAIIEDELLSVNKRIEDFYSQAK